jgi:hypothetical protein
MLGARFDEYLLLSHNLQLGAAGKRKYQQKQKRKLNFVSTGKVICPALKGGESRCLLL